MREAKILRLASDHNYQHQKGMLMHTENATLVAAYRDTPKMPWNDETIDKMLLLEQNSADWQTTIHFMPIVHDHYLSYESLLLEEDRRQYLDQVVAFLSPVVNQPSLSSRSSHGDAEAANASNLLQLHEPTCSDRIENYESFVSHPKAKGSRSAAACRMLEVYYKNSQ